METEKIKRKAVPITTIYKPANYKDIEPGSVLLSLETGKLWRAMSSTDNTVTVIPYSGGYCYTLFSETSRIEFGLITDPEILPEVIAL